MVGFVIKYQLQGKLPLAPKLASKFVYHSRGLPRSCPVHKSGKNISECDKSQRLTRTQAVNHQRNGNDKTPQQNHATGAQRGKSTGYNRG